MVLWHVILNQKYSSLINRKVHTLRTLSAQIWSEIIEEEPCLTDSIQDQVEIVCSCLIHCHYFRCSLHLWYFKELGVFQPYLTFMSKQRLALWKDMFCKIMSAISAVMGTKFQVQKISVREIYQRFLDLKKKKSNNFLYLLLHTTFFHTQDNIHDWLSTLEYYRNILLSLDCFFLLFIYFKSIFALPLNILANVHREKFVYQESCLQGTAGECQVYVPSMAAFWHI